MNIPREGILGFLGWAQSESQCREEEEGGGGEKEGGEGGTSQGRGRCWRLEMGPVDRQSGASGEKGEGAGVRNA